MYMYGCQRVVSSLMLQERRLYSCCPNLIELLFLRSRFSLCKMGYYRIIRYWYVCVRNGTEWNRDILRNNLRQKCVRPLREVINAIYSVK